MKKKLKLPKAILPFPNADKEFHEKWTAHRDWANIIHPFRAILAGSPNCGKGCLALNMVLRANPEFEKIYLLHPDIHNTKEWDIIEHEKLQELPQIDEVDPDIKNLLIIDDVDIKSLNPAQKSLMDRFFGYVSTHKNLSIILTCQDIFSVQPNVRRLANVYVLWKLHDLSQAGMLSRRIGLSKEDLREIFHEFKDVHDSLFIDLTDRSPQKYRMNIYDAIEIN